jgi:hypothetical protein
MCRVAATFSYVTRGLREKSTSGGIDMPIDETWWNLSISNPFQCWRFKTCHVRFLTNSVKHLVAVILDLICRTRLIRCRDCCNPLLILNAAGRWLSSGVGRLAESFQPTSGSSSVCRNRDSNCGLGTHLYFIFSRLAMQTSEFRLICRDVNDDIWQAFWQTYSIVE